jgi:hypothetical protein
MRITKIAGSSEKYFFLGDYLKNLFPLDKIRD